MKQDVLNYETDIIRHELDSQKHFDLHDPNSCRYGIWDLQNTLDKLINKTNATVKWIGNDPNANMLAFFYAILVGCLHEDKRSEDIFLKFKHCLYQESRQTLSIGEQKIFVQHLGLLQYSKDIGEFLKKSRHLESILMKIFTMRRKQMVKKNLKTTKDAPHNKIYELQWYSVMFPFIQFQVLDEKSGKLTINEKIFFIVEQKCCFFVAEMQASSKTSGTISSVSSHKNLRSTPNITKMHSLDSFKFLTNSKHENLEGIQKQNPINLHDMSNMKSHEESSSASKKTSQHDFKTTLFQYVNQSELQEPQPRNPKKSFNIMDHIMEIQQTLDQDIQGYSQKLKDNKGFERKSDLLDSLRSTLNKQKVPTKDFDNVFQKFPPPDTFNIHQKNPERAEEKKQTRKEYELEKRDTPKFPIRSEFASQSLSPNQISKFDIHPEKRSPQPKGTSPRFLERKKDSSSFTPHLTPTKNYEQISQKLSSPQSGKFWKKDTPQTSVPVLNQFSVAISPGTGSVNPRSTGNSPRNFDKKPMPFFSPKSTQGGPNFFKRQP